LLEPIRVQGDDATVPPEIYGEFFSLPGARIPKMLWTMASKHHRNGCWQGKAVHGIDLL